LAQSKIVTPKADHLPGRSTIRLKPPPEVIAVTPAAEVPAQHWTTWSWRFIGPWIVRAVGSNESLRGG
jgi:hypothetical protein